MEGRKGALSFLSFLYVLPWALTIPLLNKVCQKMSSENRKILFRKNLKKTETAQYSKMRYMVKAFLLAAGISDWEPPMTSLWLSFCIQMQNWHHFSQKTNQSVANVTWFYFQIALSSDVLLAPNTFLLLCYVTLTVADQSSALTGRTMNKLDQEVHQLKGLKQL